MATTTYHGSCQCKRVRFEADIDLAAVGTTKCNCTSCWKRRWWAVKVKPEGFRALEGQGELTDANFCRHCGITTYAQVAAAEWNDGAYVSVNVATLDDLDPTVLMDSPIQLCDGRNDNWW